MKVIFIIFTFIVNAYCCDEYNLYKTNKSFASIPISDQDSIGACYAYTATTLIDTERFENGVDPSKRIHPLWAAYTYKMYGLPTHGTIESGSAYFAIKGINELGICLESVGAKLIKKYKGLYSLSDAKFMNVIENAFIVNTVMKDKDLSEEDKYDAEEKACKVISKKSSRTILDIIANDLSIVQSEIVPTMVAGEIFKGCVASKRNKPKIEIESLKQRNCKNCGNRRLESYIVSQLKRDKPVAIGYCADVLSDKNHEGVKVPGSWDFFKDRKRKKGNCSGHESIVAGSRKKDNKCQLLVRNTWGDWKSKTWKNCLCETSKGVYEACSRGDSKVNSVGCWVDSDKLTKNIFRTTHF